MRSARIAILAACSLALLAGLAVAPRLAARADDVPAVGAMAPNFTLEANDKSTISLADYRGKWVVLYFYPADFTTGCTLEAHNFQQDLDKYTALNAVILGVSVQDVTSHQSFCDKEGLHFHLLADVDHNVSTLYGSLGAVRPGRPQYALRHTFIIDPSGKIVQEFMNVNENIGDHSAQVLDAIKSAKSGAASPSL